MTKTQAAAYLAGMIDGEGHIRVRRNRMVEVANTDRDLIEAVVECCELLGLRHRLDHVKAKPEKNRKQAWKVVMSGKDTLTAIQRKVPIRATHKQEALADALTRYKQTPRPPREWIEQKYVVEGLSLQQCAELWGVKNAMSALNWMKYYDIPRRSVGEAMTKYPRPEREWLAERLAEGLTLEQIGQLADAPLEAVWRWRKHYALD